MYMFSIVTSPNIFEFNLKLFTFPMRITLWHCNLDSNNYHSTNIDVWLVFLVSLQFTTLIKSEAHSPVILAYEFNKEIRTTFHFTALRSLTGFYFINGFYLIWQEKLCFKTWQDSCMFFSNNHSLLIAKMYV